MFQANDLDFLSCFFVKLRKATISFCMSVCLSARMEQLGSHWTIFMTFVSSVFFENLTRIMNTLHEICDNI